MLTNNRFLYRKLVDKSVLTDGFTIPVDHHKYFFSALGVEMPHGSKRMVKIILEGKEFDCQFINQGFDKEKFAGHTDVVQFRYLKSSPLSQHLRGVFSVTNNYVQTAYAKRIKGDRKQLKIPEEINEFIQIFATSQPDVFVMECLTCAESKEIKEATHQISEEEFEAMTDTSATIHIVPSLKKIRVLDRSIGNTLKHLYDYRCQITGEKIGGQYDADVVEAHHIEPFTTSLNNDSKNIIILSPSFHRIVHAAKPHFNYKTLAFEFQNGVVEPVRLNKHL